jgi:PhnB protein
MAKKKSKVKKPVVAKRKTPAKAAPKKKSRVPAAASSTRPKWISEGSTAISPLLIVRDVEAALDFYQTVFGFRVRGVMRDRKKSILHAEMTYRDSIIMLNPENAKMGALAPQGRSPVTLYVYVADVDAVADVARLNGGNVLQQPTNMFWGDRCCMIIDPDGHMWTIATHVKNIAVEDMVIPPSVN